MNVHEMLERLALVKAELAILRGELVHLTSVSGKNKTATQVETQMHNMRTLLNRAYESADEAMKELWR